MFVTFRGQKRRKTRKEFRGLLRRKKKPTTPNPSYKGGERGVLADQGGEISVGKAVSDSDDVGKGRTSRGRKAGGGVVGWGFRRAAGGVDYSGGGEVGGV